MTKTEVSSPELAKLLGLTQDHCSWQYLETFRLQDGVRNYVEHLRRLSAEQESGDTVKQPSIERKR
jgi:hypothetical protein